MHNLKAFAWERKSQFERWIDSLHLKSVDFIRFATVFGLGFLCGILMKRYAKYIVLVGVSLVIVLAVLQNFAIITINIAKIQKITGLQDITNLNNLLVALIVGAKQYALELSCSGVGFIFGFKTG